MKKFRPIIIAVAGGSGSGKTWLADELAAALGRDTVKISLDGFYRDRSRLSPSRRERINYDHPRCIDWAGVEKAVRRLASGASALVPAYDFATHSRLDAKVELRPGRFIILEGLWVLRRPALRRLFHLKLYKDCPQVTRLARRATRDRMQRGRSLASVRQQFVSTVQPMHEVFVAPQARWADLVVGAHCRAATISEIATRARDLARATSHFPFKPLSITEQQHL